MCFLIAIIDSEYIRSEENGVIGKKVEFVPNYNIKTGIKLGIGNFIFNTSIAMYQSNSLTRQMLEGNIVELLRNTRLQSSRFYV